MSAPHPYLFERAVALEAEARQRQAEENARIAQALNRPQDMSVEEYHRQVREALQSEQQMEMPV